MEQWFYPCARHKMAIVEKGIIFTVITIVVDPSHMQIIQNKRTHTYTHKAASIYEQCAPVVVAPRFQEQAASTGTVLSKQYRAGNEHCAMGVLR